MNRWLSIALALPLTLSACGADLDATSGDADAAATSDAATNDAATSDAASGAITAQEASDLRALREEEKLARDVYLALSPRAATIFDNIARSEQSHMDAVAVLLARYGVDDPALAERGRFTDPAMQGLYDALTARGVDERAALTVGVEVEELDLADIARLREHTARADVLATYDRLATGSRNHLRSFYARLTAAGGAYTPRHLDRATFDAVVASPRETGPQ
ncbi:MAG: DUF2202 domain-containing protein [Polyangiales bacterium]